MLPKKQYQSGLSTTTGMASRAETVKTILFSYFDPCFGIALELYPNLGYFLLTIYILNYCYIKNNQKIVTYISASYIKAKMKPLQNSTFVALIGPRTTSLGMTTSLIA